MTNLVLWMDSSQTFPVHQSGPFSIFLLSHDGALNCGQKFPSTHPVHECQGHLGLFKNHFFEMFFRGETIVQHSSLMTLKNKFELMLKFLWSTQFKGIHIGSHAEARPVPRKPRRIMRNYGRCFLSFCQSWYTWSWKWARCVSVKVASSRDKIRSAGRHLSHKHDIKVISRPAWGVTEASTHMKYMTAVFLYSLTQYLQWTQHFRFTLNCNNHSNSFTKNQHDQIKTLSQSKLRKHWQADTFQIFITKLRNLYGIQ